MRKRAQGLFLLRHLAAVAQYEGVLLAVGAFYAPVLELDGEGAGERSTRGECAGGEDGVDCVARLVELVGLAPSSDRPGAVGPIVTYPPIPLSAVFLFPFG